MRTTTLILMLLALAFPVSASECAPTTFQSAIATPATGVDVARDFGDAQGPSSDEGVYYVAQDRCFFCLTGEDTWIYQETNGIPGLQRGDEVVDNTCEGAIPADFDVFSMDL